MVEGDGTHEDGDDKFWWVTQTVVGNEGISHKEAEKETTGHDSHDVRRGRSRVGVRTMLL